MKILPERVFVHADSSKREFTVVMEGFRMTLSTEEAQALKDALAQALKEAAAGETRPPHIIGLTGTGGSASDNVRL